MAKYTINFYQRPINDTPSITYKLECSKANIVQKVQNEISNKRFKQLENYSIDIKGYVKSSTIIHVYIISNIIFNSGVYINIKDTSTSIEYKIMNAPFEIRSDGDRELISQMLQIITKHLSNNIQLKDIKHLL